MNTTDGTRKCEICGRTKPVEEFSKAYKRRCKMCAAQLQRKKRMADKAIAEDISAIILKLDHKKNQARQLYPGTIVVPYETAVKVVNQVIEYFKKKKE